MLKVCCCFCCHFLSCLLLFSVLFTCLSDLPIHLLISVAKLSMYSGTLSLGIGDSVAAIVGNLYGKVKWPGRRGACSISRQISGQKSPCSDILS